MKKNILKKNLPVCFSNHLKRSLNLLFLTVALTIAFVFFKPANAYSYDVFDFLPRAEIKRYIPITEPNSRHYIKQKQNQKYNQTPPEQVDQAKNNYKFSPFGRLAFKGQTRLIQGVKFLEGCTFPEKSYEFKHQEAVQFIFRNENDYTIHLIFSAKNIKSEQKEIEYKLNQEEAINFHHVKIKPKSRRVWNWQFNHAKEFDWLCYNEELEPKASVGIKVTRN